MSSRLVSRFLTLAVVGGMLSGCALKSSKPAADITLAQSPAVSTSVSPRAQEASSGIPSGVEVAPGSSTLMTDAGAQTNLRSGDIGTVSVQPPSARPSQTLSSPIAYKQIVSEHRPKQCKGKDCPSLRIRQIEFVGQAKFNAFLDHALATMAGLDQEFVPPYRNLKELVAYFIQTAKPRQTIDLKADVVRATNEIIVVRMDSYLFNGGAHGISATQYVNWVFKTDRLLSLESMLLPGGMPKYLAVLKAQHMKWLAANPVRQDNPAKYDQVWPFVPSDNVALMEKGLAVQYDPYTIAPGSFGMPVITIPYDVLEGIIRPEVLQLAVPSPSQRGTR